MSATLPADFAAYATDPERQIAHALIVAMLAAGFLVTINDGEDDTLIRSDSLSAIGLALATTGEDYVRFYRPSFAKPAGWFHLIYGNDTEVIANYTANDATEALADPALRLAETLDGML